MRAQADEASRALASSCLAAYGRAMVITGESQRSQCAGLEASPSALSTDSFTKYVPLGTT